MSQQSIGELPRLLHQDEEFWAVIRQFPWSERVVVEEAYDEVLRAFDSVDDRKTGERAFEHCRRAGLAMARFMLAVGCPQGMPVAAELRHDLREDTRVTQPYESRDDGYRRMPVRYGLLQTRIILLVTRAEDQTEETHLQQLLAGQDIGYLELLKLRSVEDQILDWVTRVVRLSGHVVRRALGQPMPVRRYLLPRQEWGHFLALVIKLFDRIDNLRTYCHPKVYGNRPEHLRYKLELTKRYYVPMAEKVVAMAPKNWKWALEVMVQQPLLELIAKCEAFLDGPNHDRECGS
ncbi:MAG TPA: hypothetical protein VLF67_01365 [Candidatus Saccharimonas sp.]|nr:hypothetical protein [Candidatus Saccharimonas sp.]